MKIIQIYTNNLKIRQKNFFAHNNNSNNNWDEKGINPFKQEDKKIDLSNIKNYMSESCLFCQKFIKEKSKEAYFCKHIDKLDLKN